MPSQATQSDTSTTGSPLSTLLNWFSSPSNLQANAAMIAPGGALDVPGIVGRNSATPVPDSSPIQTKQSKSNGASSTAAPAALSAMQYLPLPVQASPQPAPSTTPGYSTNVVNNANTASNMLNRFSQGAIDSDTMNNLRNQAQMALDVGATTLATPGTSNGLTQPQLTNMAALVGGNPLAGVPGWAAPANQLQQSLLGQGVAAGQENDLQHQRAQALLANLAPQSVKMLDQGQSQYGNPLAISAQGSPQGGVVFGNQGLDSNKQPYVLQGMVDPDTLNKVNIPRERAVIDQNNKFTSGIWNPQSIGNTLNGPNGIKSQLSALAGTNGQFKIDASDLAALNKAGVDLSQNYTSDGLNKVLAMKLPVSNQFRTAIGVIQRAATLPGGDQVAGNLINGALSGNGLNIQDAQNQINGLSANIEQQRAVVGNQAKAINVNRTLGNQGRTDLDRAAYDAGQQYTQTQQWNHFQDEMHQRGISPNDPDFAALWAKTQNNFNLGGQ